MNKLYKIQHRNFTQDTTQHLKEDLLTELQLLRDNPVNIIEEAKLVAKELINLCKSNWRHYQKLD